MATEHPHPKEYHLVIDHHPHTWPEKLISGAQIKALAGVDPSYGVWQEVAGGHDLEIQDTQSVDLSHEGVEKFFTAKKQTTEGNA